MTLYAQVTLLTDSMDTADNQSSGFAIEGGSADPGDLAAWVTAIKEFYDDVQFLGGNCGLVQNGHIVKVYEVNQPKPNYPIFTDTFNLASDPPAIQLPMEMALCISYANTTVNSVARARRRGRIYLSGWTESFNDEGRPVEANLSTLAGYYASYCGAVNAIPLSTAAIWSRAADTFFDIDTIWVDNEWDTQRRRGGKATERYTVTI